MKLLLPSLAAAALSLLASCATSRTSFAPDDSPPTVGMPAELSERERTYIREIDSTLRNQGYLPVRHGSGEMQLDFQIAEGPINIDTTIELREQRRIIAKGFGRAGGVPMIGRAKVAERSFSTAFGEFQSTLPGGGSSGSSSHSSPRNSSDSQQEEYIY